MTLITRGRQLCLLASAATLALGSLVVSTPEAVAAPGDLARVSVATNGAQANGASGDASVNANGRFVAFQSTATNLVTGDTNGATDVFVRDRQTNTTTRMSVTSGGVQANGPSYDPSISADGRWVAFTSEATNLFTGDTNGQGDVFVRDRQSSTTSRVNWGVNNVAGGSPSISGNGRYVAFVAAGAVFVRDLQAGTTARVSVSVGGAPSSGDSPSIDNDGRYVAFSSTALAQGISDKTFPEVFIRDRLTNTTSMVPSLADADGAWQSSISADGRYVVSITRGWEHGWCVEDQCHYEGDVAEQLYDRSTNTATPVDPHTPYRPDDTVSVPALSGEGRYVVNGNDDVFVLDRQTNTTTRVDRSSDGIEANGRSRNASISANGRYVAFQSEASNLVSGDTNGVTDVFVKDRSAASAPVVSDSFGRTVSNGWGSAATGGAYSIIGPASSFSVNGSVGLIASSTGGVDRRALLRAVSVQDTTALVKFTTDKKATGTGQYVWLSSRDRGTAGYRAVALLKSDGSVRLILRRVVSGTTTELAARTIPGLTYAPGTPLMLRTQTAGGTPTLFKAKVWTAGTTEPAWQLSATDASPITTAGGIDVGTYQSTVARNLPVTNTFDNLTVTTP